MDELNVTRILCNKCDSMVERINKELDMELHFCIGPDSDCDTFGIYDMRKKEYLCIGYNIDVCLCFLKGVYCGRGWSWD